MFLKFKNIIFKIKRSKVTDYAALSVKRSDKKNAPHFKCLEKRQEKCATLKRQEKLLHFKCQEKRQEKCSTFQVSREATRKMRHI